LVASTRSYHLKTNLISVKIVFFCHSLLSDWNHGNAHFLRGICSELHARGYDVTAYEPEYSWSYQNLLADEGERFLAEFKAAYPHLRSIRYGALDLGEVLNDADLAIVHEWNPPDLIAAIGAIRARSSSFRLFFHDSHHRAATQPDRMAKLDLSGYDGVLAYGTSIRDIYLRNGWGRRAWTWHEAADTRVFRPFPQPEKEYDLAWIGNWGDDERTRELYEFLIEPVRDLGLKAIVYGVRYPDSALQALADAGIRYGGWLANFCVPGAFARARATVHVPRRPYMNILPGIPTIRPFEALACGIPMVSAPWQDTEGLFRAGKDFLFAENGKEMTARLDSLLAVPSLAREVVENGLQTIRNKHTCGHRVDQLLEILDALNCEE
jgi:spore maturation protein CgeB